MKYDCHDTNIVIFVANRLLDAYIVPSIALFPLRYVKVRNCLRLLPGQVVAEIETFVTFPSRKLPFCIIIAYFVHIFRITDQRLEYDFSVLEVVASQKK